MIDWKVGLMGREEDIQYLSTLLQADECRVEKIDGIYYLKSDKLISFSDANEVVKLAGEIFNSAKMLTELLYDRKISVDLDGSASGRDEHGNIAIMPSPATVKVTVNPVTVVISGGDEDSQIIPSQERKVESPRQPSDLEQAIPILMGNNDVADAVRIYCKEQSWSNLYKVFEIIESDIGDKYITYGWATKKDAERFTRTANSRLAIGDDARHGHKKFAPPKNPMSLYEAKSLIRNILINWIRSKRNEP